MIKKEILIGFITGILSNIIGILLYVWIFSDISLYDTLEESFINGFLGTLITAGAILNFLPFFIFLKKKQLYRARGVLLASILAALLIAVLKFIVI
jgi:Mg/Co/Ni transporter MgtE